MAQSANKATSPPISAMLRPDEVGASVWGAAVGADAGATRGSAAPQFLHLRAPAAFIVPQLGHLISGAGAVSNAPRTAPCARAAAPFRSPPHCLQLTALPALRVPQKGQIMSGPTPAASSFALSVMSSCWTGASNFPC